VHSDYSLLHGSIRVGALAARSAELGMPAAALTDHGNLFGAVDFYLACRKHGVKPILGTEATVCANHRSREARAAGALDAVVLLATNGAGWKNLVKLSSTGYLHGMMERPRIDLELLDRHRDGLLVLSGGMHGQLQSRLAEGDLNAARQIAQSYIDIVGPEQYYVEIQNHGLESERRRRELSAQLATEMGLRLVATNNAHYLRPSDAPSHDVLLAIAQQVTVDQPGRFRYEGDQWDLKDPDAMAERFVDYPDAVENTLRIAERCDVELPLDDHLLPAFPLPSGFERPEDYLANLAREGVRARYGDADDEVRERLDYELSVIEETGFAGYFLIVSDFVKAARDRDIAVGPGRGSAAGSLVCYAIGITDVDPMEHELLFERFLNPERVSMPDIDIDFCFERRDEIIDYVIHKYGESSVCQIITYGTMLARGVLRDTGRALGLNYGEVDRIAKLVPEQLGITLEEALEAVSELREMRELDPRYDRLIATALQLEGLHRHSSIHAAGILIAPGDLTDHVPLHMTSKEEVTTQWDMKMCEKAGLLKMDFLGLRTLTVIEKALALVERTTGAALNAADIPMDDPEVYQLLCRGETIGIFQLESSGMQEVLRKLEPSLFEHITAVNALYRPGPLGSGMVDTFVESKHGRAQAQYLHPILEPILEPTYGVILYQEQVMRIASDMGGFTLGQADTLRKAMGKKQQSVMDKMMGPFLDGAEERGVPRPIAKQTWDLMEKFALYGFNKSHSASYAVLSLQTAWLKTHHPACFLAATLSSEMGSTARVVTLVYELRRCGVTLIRPDINRSGWEFDVEDDAVVYGLGAIKNVGRGAVEAIIDARERLGRGFRSLYELCDELDSARVNRRVLESLTLAGALDTLPGSREQKLAALDLALARAQRRARDRDRGQASLFEAASSAQSESSEGVLPEVEPWGKRERLRRERELTGLYLSGHPMDEERAILDWLRPTMIENLDDMELDEPVAVCGMLTSMKSVTTRRTQQLIRFIGFEDLTGSRELVCYNEPYEKHREALASDDTLLIVGRTSRRDGDDETRIVVEKALRLEDACAKLIRRLEIVVPPDPDGAIVDRILDAIAAHPGPCPLCIALERDGFSAQMQARRAAVQPSAPLLLELVAALGPEAVHPIVSPPERLVGRREGRSWRQRAAKASANR